MRLELKGDHDKLATCAQSVQNDTHGDAIQSQPVHATKAESDSDKLATCAQFVTEAILMTTRVIHDQSIHQSKNNNHDELATCAQSVYEARLTTTRFIRNLSIRLKAEK